MHDQFGVPRHADQRHPVEISILYDDIRLDLKVGASRGTTCREARAQVDIGPSGHGKRSQIDTVPAAIAKRRRDLRNPRKIAVDGRHSKHRPALSGSAATLIGHF